MTTLTTAASNNASIVVTAPTTKKSKQPAPFKPSSCVKLKSPIARNVASDLEATKVFPKREILFKDMS